jgi:hypothetical protein
MSGHYTRANSAPEAALLARLRAGRDDRHEQRAFLDLPADRRIPRVAAAQLALVEPDVEACSTGRVADAQGAKSSRTGG